MNLFRLLRLVSSNIPLVILDINGQELVRVFSKDDLTTELYDYQVFEINGIIDAEFFQGKIPALLISIVK